MAKFELVEDKSNVLSAWRKELTEKDYPSIDDFCKELTVIGGDTLIWRKGESEDFMIEYTNDYNIIANYREIK